MRTKDTGEPTALYLISSLAPEENRTNYIAEADIHWQGSASTEGLYGLVFGATEDASKYYFVALFPDLQGYRIYFFDSTLPIADRLRVLSPLTTNKVIQSGTAVNHIRVERSGSSIKLIVNGANLGSWTDASLIGATRAGVIAVAINPASSPVVEARYDNFKLSSCGCATAVTTPALKQITAVPTPLHTILPETLFDLTP